MRKLRPDFRKLIPVQGTRSHRPQIRAHMQQLKIPAQTNK